MLVGNCRCTDWFGFSRGKYPFGLSTDTFFWLVGGRGAKFSHRCVEIPSGGPPCMCSVVHRRCCGNARAGNGSSQARWCEVGKAQVLWDGQDDPSVVQAVAGISPFLLLCFLLFLSSQQHPSLPLKATSQARQKKWDCCYRSSVRNAQISGAKDAELQRVPEVLCSLPANHGHARVVCVCAARLRTAKLRLLLPGAFYAPVCGALTPSAELCPILNTRIVTSVGTD